MHQAVAQSPRFGMGVEGERKLIAKCGKDGAQKDHALYIKENKNVSQKESDLEKAAQEIYYCIKVAERVGGFEESIECSRRKRSREESQC